MCPLTSCFKRLGMMTSFASGQNDTDKFKFSSQKPLCELNDCVFLLQQVYLLNYADFCKRSIL